MPIEIRELVIKATVSAPIVSKPAGAPDPSPGAWDADHQALIAECVEQVMDLLRDAKER